MATSVQIIISSPQFTTAEQLAKSEVPTWEVPTPTLRGVLYGEIFNYRNIPTKFDQALSLVERAKKWQDLPKEKTIWVLKCITTALLTASCALAAIFTSPWISFITGFYALFSYLLFFKLEDSITSEVFSIKPDWESLAQERRELALTYSDLMTRHIDLLTTKIQALEILIQQQKGPNADREKQLNDLVVARDTLQKIWNWISA